MILGRPTLWMGIAAIAIACAAPRWCLGQSPEPDKKEQGTAFQPAPLPEGAIRRLGDCGLYQDDVASVVAFSPDGRILASGGGSLALSYRRKGGDRLPPPDIYLWDVESGQLLRRLSTHQGGISDLVFSQDGLLLASGSNDGTAKVWRVATGKYVFLDDRSRELREVSCLAISPDGGRLAAAGLRGAVEIWNAETGDHVRSFNTDMLEMRRIAYDAQHSRLAVAGQPRGSGGLTCRVWDLTANKLLWELNERDERTPVVFSPDAKMLALARLNGTISVYETATGETIAEIPRAILGPSAVAFTPDSKSLVVRSDREAKAICWNLETKSPVAEFSGLPSCRSLAAASDRKRLAVTCNHHAVVVEPGVGRLRWPRTGLAGGVQDFATSSDGKTVVAIGFRARRISLWLVESGRRLASVPLETSEGRFTSAISPSGAFVAVVGGRDAPMQVLRMPSGEKVALQWPRNVRDVVSARFVTDDELYVLTEGGDVVVVSLSSRSAEVAAKLNRSVFLASFSPPGSQVAVLDRDGAMSVAETQRGKVVWSKPLSFSNFSGRALPEFSPDGLQLAQNLDARPDNGVLQAGDGFPLIILDARNGEAQHRLTGLRDSNLGGLVWSNDGRWLATSGDRGIVVFDTHAWKLAAEYEKTIGAWLYRFTPDGKQLRTSGYDGTVLEWPLPSKCDANLEIQHVPTPVRHTLCLIKDGGRE